MTECMGLGHTEWKTEMCTEKKDHEVKLLLCTYFVRSLCPVDISTNDQQLILKEKIKQLW